MNLEQNEICSFSFAHCIALMSKKYFIGGTHGDLEIEQINGEAFTMEVYDELNKGYVPFDLTHEVSSKISTLS